VNLSANELARAGITALQRGDGPGARARFETLARSAAAPAPIHLLLAQACRLCGDEQGEAQAIDRALALDGGNLKALVMRGDCYARAGDAKAAVSFYQHAMAAAAALTSVPPVLAADLERAQAFVARTGSELEERVRQRLAEADVEAERFPRIREALDLLFGRAEIFPQAPTLFYFPGLPQRQFYEREEFAWHRDVEAATGAIRGELLAYLEEGADFRPYVEAERDRPQRDDAMAGNPDWTACYLWKDGARVEEALARFPSVEQALAPVPSTRLERRTPAILFSRLTPGAHIPPHHGMLNCRLICHLPLIVPQGCWLRVGNETRSWEEGRLLVFDDSIQHEAKNGSDRERVILLFDIWRPELSETERRGVAAIFRAIDPAATAQ
jgi:aspartyl/asparaginyl beta-hydroxylase (cupin superfamily)